MSEKAKSLDEMRALEFFAMLCIDLGNHPQDYEIVREAIENLDEAATEQAGGQT